MSDPDSPVSELASPVWRPEQERPVSSIATKVFAVIGHLANFVLFIFICERMWVDKYCNVAQYVDYSTSTSCATDYATCASTCGPGACSTSYATYYSKCAINWQSLDRSSTGYGYMPDNDYAQMVSLHIYLMVLFLCFTAAGLLLFVFKPGSNQEYPKTQLALKIVHGILVLGGVITSILGIIAMLQAMDNIDQDTDGNLDQKATKKSVHCWMGYCAISTYYLQFALGVAFLTVPACFPQKWKDPIKEFLTHLHRPVGLAAFFMIVAQVVCGFYQQQFFAYAYFGLKFWEDPQQIYSWTAIPIAILCICVLVACSEESHRTQSPSKSRPRMCNIEDMDGLHLPSTPNPIADNGEKSGKLTIQTEDTTAKQLAEQM